MADKISASLRRAADQSPEFRCAGTDLHHINLGPGGAVLAEYAKAGLELPDLDAMREYRLGRVREQLRLAGLGGILLMDPMNIRYATDTTNMQIWVMHNAARYAWVSTDGPVIVWDFYECDFMAGHNGLVDEVRPAIGSTYFLAGPRWAEKERQFADEIIAVAAEHAGPGEKIAIDQCSWRSVQYIQQAGFTVANGQELMERTRVIKGPDEIKAMRCAVNSCEHTMAEMHAALEPGMTERELWAMLHAGNIRRGGEWIETQIIASGPRTNPWMQEASSRVIEAGDLVGYDTDLVGAYGMMVDVSRTWLAGDKPAAAAQQHIHSLASEAVETNIELLTPGRSLRELCFDTFIPPNDDYRHYCVQFHGVGQCDEYPEVPFPEAWDEWGYDAVLEPNMVLTVESFVGPRDGGEGVKLENQVLVTEHGPERLDRLTNALSG